MRTHSEGTILISFGLLALLLAVYGKLTPHQALATSPGENRSSPTQITNFPGASKTWFEDALLSGNGRSVAYGDDDPLNGWQRNLYLANADGSGAPLQFDSGNSDPNLTSMKLLDISYDGQKVLYFRGASSNSIELYASGNYGLFLFDAIKNTKTKIVPCYKDERIQSRCLVADPEMVTLSGDGQFVFSANFVGGWNCKPAYNETTKKWFWECGLSLPYPDYYMLWRIPTQAGTDPDAVEFWGNLDEPRPESASLYSFGFLDTDYPGSAASLAITFAGPSTFDPASGVYLSRSPGQLQQIQPFTDTSSINIYPRLSADGNWLAFLDWRSYVPFDPAHPVLYHLRNLANGQDDQHGVPEDYSYLQGISQNGQQLLFETFAHSVEFAELYLVDPGGAAAPMDPDVAKLLWDGKLSYDGQTIAFSMNMSDGSYQLFVLNGPPSPDLNIASIFPDLALASYSGGRYHLPVSVTVGNDGDAGVTDVTVQLTDNFGHRETRTLPSLPADDKAMITIDWDITNALVQGQGTADLLFTATVDPDDQISERSNLNNTATQAKHVDARPVVTRIDPEYLLGWFIEGTSVYNQIDVTADWNGQLPGQGENVAGEATFDLNGTPTVLPAAGGTQVSHTYNMGSDLVVGENHLGFSLSNASGFVSETTFRQFWQSQEPTWLHFVPGTTLDVVRIARPGPDLVDYRYAVKFPPAIIQGAVTAPKNQAGPLGGKLGPTIPIWELWGWFRSDGHGLISGLAGMQTDLKDLPFKGKKLGGGYSYGGRIQGNIQADQAGRFRLTELWGILRGSGRLTSPRWRLPQAPIISFQLVGGLDIELLTKILERMDTGELSFAPEVVLRFDPLVEGIGLVGEKGLAYAEGALGAKPRAEFQFFQTPSVKTLLLRTYIRVSAGVLWFEKTSQWTWQYDLLGRQAAAGLSPWRNPSPWTSAGWKTTARDYLTPGYAAFAGTGRTVTQTVHPIVTSIYPHADPGAAYLGNGEVLALWVHDDPGKPSHQSFELNAARWNGTSWTAPLSVTQDIINDFTPTLAPTNNGALAVWTRFKHAITGTVPTSPTQVLDLMEVAYAIYDKDTGTWSTPQWLTDNSIADFLPGATGRNGQVLVMWLQDPDNNFPLYPDETAALAEDLYYALWDGGAWVISPTLALSGVATDEQPQFAFDGSQAVLVWSGDTDGNASTVADRELYFSQWDTSSNTWSSPLALTSDGYADRSPRLVTDSSGIPHLVWIKEIPEGGDPASDDFTGQLNHTTFDGVAWATSTPAVEVNGISGLALTNAWENGKDNLVAVWRGGSEALSDLYESVYDFSADGWSRPIQLTHSRAAETAFEAVYDAANDEAFLILLQQQVITETVNVSFPISYTDRSMRTTLTETVPITMPVFGASDLVWTAFTPAPDLTLSANDITLSPANPLPGSTAVVSATVHNAGDLAAAPVKVAFYDGDPDNGGGQIDALQAFTSTLGGGITATAQVTWQVPVTTSVHTLYVRVDPLNEVTEADENNNQAFQVTTLPDLAVEYGYASYSSPVSTPTITLTAHITNQGAYPADEVAIAFRQDAITGTLLGQQTLPTLLAGASQTVTVTWEITPGEPSTHTIYALVDPADTIAEADEDNNTGIFWASILPDLTLSAEDLQKPDPLTIAVKNRGYVTATNVTITARAGSLTGTLLYSTTLPILPPAETGVFTTTLAPGTYTLFVKVDASDTIPEQDESNNLVAFNVLVRRKVFLPFIVR